LTNDLSHVSLFTGIDSFDLAAEWAGFKNILQVEKDKYCLQVLNKNFPGVEKIEDIRNIRNEDIPAGITVLSGGFPCQPFSIAGKRRGESDDRYLWPRCQNY
jgi:DNA (cytosine-5)-methyltransferase 1